MENNGFFDNLASCWQAKTAISAGVTLATFLFGGFDAGMAALGVLLFLDLVTRWAALAGQAARKDGAGRGILAGLRLAWQGGTIGSCRMREKFLSKAFAYIVLLIAANLLAKIAPPITVLGIDLARGPNQFVAIYLALTEAASIVENLADLGVDTIRPLSTYLYGRRDAMTGQKETGQLAASRKTAGQKEGV